MQNPQYDLFAEFVIMSVEGVPRSVDNVPGKYSLLLRKPGILDAPMI